MLQSVYLRILSSFNIILIGLATNGSTFCDDVHCEHSNPCQTIISHVKGDNHVTAQCVCRGKWAGRRCESQIYVTSGLITSSSAEVVISVRSLVTNTTAKPDLKHFSYTLMYWNNGSDHACALIQELTSQRHRVDGLEPETDYTICVESGVVENCVLTYHNESALSTNCLFLTTTSFSSQSYSTNVAAVAACVLIVIVVLATIFAAVLIRRRHFVLIDNICAICRCVSCCTCCRKKRPQAPQAATDMIVSPDSPLMGTSSKIDFSPPSPGKPKHRLVKQRNRGYASYFAKNDQKIVLTTVLENNQEFTESEPLSTIT